MPVHKHDMVTRVRLQEVALGGPIRVVLRGCKADRHLEEVRRLTWGKAGTTAVVDLLPVEPIAMGPTTASAHAVHEESITQPRFLFDGLASG